MPNNPAKPSLIKYPWLYAPPLHGPRFPEGTAARLIDEGRGD
jgi:hypothetical protein